MTVVIPSNTVKPNSLMMMMMMMMILNGSSGDADQHHRYHLYNIGLRFKNPKG